MVVRDVLCRCVFMQSQNALNGISFLLGVVRLLFRGMRLSSGREKRCHDKANTPFWRAAWTFGINFPANRELYREFSDSYQLSDGQVDGHGPLVVVPVVSAFRVNGEGGFRLCGVGEKWLKEGGADVISMFVSGVRPNVVKQESVSPAAGLLEHDQRRTRPHFSVPSRLSVAVG
jgi:hypothetical protein